MSVFAKVMAALLLTLPLGAYIAGTLVASQADLPAERQPVVLDDGLGEASSGTGPTRTPRGETRSPGPRKDRDDDHSGHGREGDDDDSDDDDDVRVIRPTPHELDDDLADELEDLADQREDRAEERAEAREDRLKDNRDREDRSGKSHDDG